MTDLLDTSNILTVEGLAKALKVFPPLPQEIIAAGRIGELVPPIPKAESNPLGRGKVSEKRTPSNISAQRLSEFRKLAEIPEKIFRERQENWGADAGRAGEEDG